jgi:hypothetical protein
MMFQNVQRTKLVAKWLPDQDASVDPPHTVIWSDGRPATQEDYLAHLEDTHSLFVSDKGIELHMFPEIIADVRYDRAAGTWKVHFEGFDSTNE